MGRRALFLAVVACSAGTAQVPAKTLHFEVVSIREAQRDAGGAYRMNYRADSRNSRVEMEQLDMQALLRYAFQANGFQIVGFPGELASPIYDLHLSGGEEVDAALKAMPVEQSEEVHRQMLQEVLVERFHLRYHWTTQEMRSALLYAGKGMKLRPSAVKVEDAGRPENKEDPASPWVGWECGAKGCAVTARGKSVA